jgi:hypothetical protein
MNGEGLGVLIEENSLINLKKENRRMQALVSGSVPMRCATECGRLEGEVEGRRDGETVGSTPGFRGGESRGVEGTHAFTSLKTGGGGGLGGRLS